MRVLVALVVAFLLFCGFAGVQRDRVETVCGPSVSTPAVIRGLDFAQGAGQTLHDMIDDDGFSTFEIVRFVRRSLDMIAMLTDSFGRALRGEREDSYATGWRKNVSEKQKVALEQCCPAQPAQPDAPDGDGGGAGEPPAWDPRNASLQLDVPFSGENLSIAKVVVREAKRAGLPERAAVVALAASMQESGPRGPRNLDRGHSSSVGAWQLIDSHGTKAQRMDPTFSVRWFYRQLKAVRGWQQLSVNDAAWRVERPRADLRGLYGRHEGRARKLLAAAGGFGGTPDPGADPEAPGASAGFCTPAGESPDSGTVEAISAPAGSFDFAGQRTPDQAVAWMRNQDARNAGGWQARCLAAVGQAYGHAGTTPVAGHFYAVGQWDAMPARYRHPGSSSPPKGALVFWKTGSAAGHIAISNGDGRVWTTDPPGRSGQIGLVSIRTIDTWGSRLGWGAPYFIGKTGAAA